MNVTSSVDKTLKRVNNTLYIEIKQHHQKCLFWVLLTLLNRKTLKFMQSTLYGITKRHYKKRLSKVFLSLSTKMRKKRFNSINRISIKKQNNIIISVYSFFLIVRYQNAKMHVKQNILGKKRYFQKNFFLSVYEHLRHLNIT